MSYISIDNQDYDLNSLFNISHTYDVLKNLIRTIIKTNRDMSYKISDLQEEVAEKDELLTKLHSDFNVERESNKIIVEETQSNFSKINKVLSSLTTNFNNLAKVFKTANEGRDDLSNLSNINIITDETLGFKDLNEIRDNEKKRAEEIMKQLQSDTSNQKKNKELKEEERKQKEQEDLKRLSVKNQRNMNMQEGPFHEKGSFKEEFTIEDDHYSNIASDKRGQGEHKGSRAMLKDLGQRGSMGGDRDVYNHIEEKLGRTSNAQLKLEETIYKINKRIVKIEKDIETGQPSGSQKRKNMVGENELSSPKDDNKIDLYNFQDLSKSIEDIREKIMSLELRGSSWDERIEELLIKSQDFNIYDMLKSGGENTDMDQSLLLIQSLEKKILKKFEYTDEKQKRIEEEQIKIKNDLMKNTKNIDMLSNEALNSKKDIESVNYEISKFQKTLAVLEENRQNEDKNNGKLPSDLHKRLEELVSNAKNNKDVPSIAELKSLVAKMLEEKMSEIVNPNLESEIGKNSKEAQRRFGEIEKQMKILSTSINIDKVNQDLAKINETIQRKVNAEDFSELKSTTNLITHQINYFKDTITQLIEDRRVLDDITWLRKKVENLSNSMNNIKNVDEVGGGLSKVGQTNIDSSKFMEVNIFNNFHKNYVKDIEIIKNLLDETKLNLDEQTEKLKQKVSEKDLKTLEEYLTVKIEETRLGLIKRFADKVDTQKSIKYLEAQIKHVVDVYVKKMEKGDNWMLAKKPVGGYTCASCENYLGELTDKANDFTAWNKYPAREVADRAYKVITIYKC